MAVEREKFEPFSMGITDTAELDDQSLLDRVLGDEPLEEIDEEEEKKKKQEQLKKATPPTQKTAPAKKADAPTEETEKEEENPIDKIFGKDKGEDDEDESAEETESTEETEEESSEVNQFEALSKELYRIGTFMHEEEGEPVIAKTPEEFKQLFDDQGQKKATKWLDGFLGRFGDNYKEMFQAVFVNGVDPNDYLPVYSEVQSLENMDLSDASNQEIIVREYYTRAGWDRDKIERKIVKMKEYADLEEEATTVHSRLVEEDKQKMLEMEEASKKQALVIKQQDDEYKSSLNKIISEKLKIKEFDGLPLNEESARKAYDFLYTKKWRAGKQELTDFDKFILETRKPENLSNRIKIALLALSNFDLTKVEKKAISKESNQIFSELVTKSAKKSSNVKKPSTNSAWLNL